MNKNINLFWKKLTDPTLLNSSVHANDIQSGHILLTVLKEHECTDSNLALRAISLFSDITYRHWDLREFFANAILHDAPQIEWIVGLLWDLGPPLPVRLQLFPWKIITAHRTLKKTQTRVFVLKNIWNLWNVFMLKDIIWRAWVSLRNVMHKHWQLTDALSVWESESPRERWNEGSRYQLIKIRLIEMNNSCESQWWTQTTWGNIQSRWVDWIFVP